MSRLDKLIKMLQAEPNDPFVLYGIAQEHATAENHAEAIVFYDKCLAADPAYLYAYYHKAVTLLEMSQEAAAQQTLETGLQAARKAGDSKALGEIQGLLDTLG